MHGRRRLALVVALGGALAVVSCGSRTGLFGSEALVETPGAPDASIDAPTAVPCIPGRFSLDLALTQLMFVIDRSGSMRFDLAGRPVPATQRNQWRWSVLESALRQTITGFDQQISMGAKFYPETTAGQPNPTSEASCATDPGVGIPPARGNAERILASFRTPDPVGGTPTSEALRLAAQFLAQSRSVARTIVLATDGAPNCNAGLDARSCTCTSFNRVTGAPTCQNDLDFGRYSCLDDGRTVSVVREIAQTRRIPVYVIGIGSTESPEFLRVLDEMAVAGGRPRATAPFHYSAQSAEALTDALGTIRDAVARCTYLTPSSPIDPDAIAVEINGQAIRRDRTKSNGWDWVDQTFGELAFFGEACFAAQAAQASVVTGVVSCD